MWPTRLPVATTGTSIMFSFSQWQESFNRTKFCVFMVADRTTDCTIGRSYDFEFITDWLYDPGKFWIWSYVLLVDRTELSCTWPCKSSKSCNYDWLRSHCTCYKGRSSFLLMISKLSQIEIVVLASLLEFWSLSRP